MFNACSDIINDPGTTYLVIIIWLFLFKYCHAYADSRSITIDEGLQNITMHTSYV